MGRTRNSYQKSFDIPILKPKKALQKAPILTPSPHGPKSRQNRSVNRARRQLRLSESEK